MQNVHRIRWCLAAVSVASAAVGALLLACGDDPASKPGRVLEDASTPAEAASQESDSAPVGDSDASSPGPEAPQFYFIHAGTDLGPSVREAVGAPDFLDGIRICLSVSLDGETYLPAPAAPFPSDAGTLALTPRAAIFRGQATTLPTYGLDLEKYWIRIYVMNAKSLAAKGVEGTDVDTPRCGELLADGGLGGPTANLVPNVDFWALPAFPAHTFKHEHTYALGLTGCSSDCTVPEFGYCGTGDDGGLWGAPHVPGLGNLKVMVLDLDRETKVAADEIGVSVMNLSAQHTSELIWKYDPDEDPVVHDFCPKIVNSIADIHETGGSRRWVEIHNCKNYPGLVFDRDAGKPTPLAKLKSVTTKTALVSWHFEYPPHGVPFGEKLNNFGSPNGASVQSASTNGWDTSEELYVNGKSYTFILVGRPATPSASHTSGPSGLHLIGLPNVQP